MNFIFYLNFYEVIIIFYVMFNILFGNMYKYYDKIFEYLFVYFEFFCFVFRIRDCFCCVF